MFWAAGPTVGRRASRRMLASRPGGGARRQRARRVLDDSGVRAPRGAVPAAFPQAAPTEASAVAPLADTIAWRDSLRRRAPAQRDRARARRSNRAPARRRAQHRACARPVRHPARRPVPVDRGQRRAERAARAGRPEHERRLDRRPRVLRRSRLCQLRARLLRSCAQPGGAGAAEPISAPRRPAAARRSAWWPRSPTLAAPGRRPRAPGAGARHLRDAPEILRAHPAQLRARRGVRRSTCARPRP